MRGDGIRAAAGLVLAAALLSGCSVNPDWQLARGEAPVAPVLLGVPFHPQTDYQCGPAALATVLGASGVAITPEALVPQVYLPGREGSLQLELVAATRRAGRIPYPVASGPEALLDEVRAGRPVLVLQNLLVGTVPRWHYAVVVGIDPARNRLLLNSGTEQGLEVAPAHRYCLSIVRCCRTLSARPARWASMRTATIWPRQVSSVSSNSTSAPGGRTPRAIASLSPAGGGGKRGTVRCMRRLMP